MSGASRAGTVVRGTARPYLAALPVLLVRAGSKTPVDDRQHEMAVRIREVHGVTVHV